MKFFYITNCKKLALLAVRSGVDRIFVDLEITGKEARQGHLNTVISRHTISDISKLRDVTPINGLLVRINPLNHNSDEEIDLVIQSGADIVMLPMFESANQVEEFISLVDSRAKVSLLLETKKAVLNSKEILSVRGIDEVHIGLNDLHLQLGSSFMFEPLVSGFLMPVFEILKKNSIPFGIGGIARVGQGIIPAELILSEHVRLGSTAAILSRGFSQGILGGGDSIGGADSSIFSEELSKLRHFYNKYESGPRELIEENHLTLVSKINQLSNNA